MGPHTSFPKLDFKLENSGNVKGYHEITMTWMTKQCCLLEVSQSLGNAFFK